MAADCAAGRVESLRRLLTSMASTSSISSSIAHQTVLLSRRIQSNSQLREINDREPTNKHLQVETGDKHIYYVIKCRNQWNIMASTPTPNIWKFNAHWLSLLFARCRNFRSHIDWRVTIKSTNKISYLLYLLHRLNVLCESLYARLGLFGSCVGMKSILFLSGQTFDSHMWIQSIRLEIVLVPFPGIRCGNELDKLIWS